MGLVLALTAWQSWGYRAAVDLHFADEVVYLESGKRLLSAFELPPLAYSPAYATLLAILHTLLPGVIATDAMYWLGAASLGLVTAWAFLPSAGRVLSCLAAIWVISSSSVVQVHSAGGTALPGVYVVGATLAMLAAGAWHRRRFGLCLLAGLVNLGVRPESGLTLAVLAIAAWPCRGSLGSSYRWILLTACLGLGIAVLPESARERGWLAFRQHYARWAVMEDARDALHGSPPDASQAAQIWLAMNAAFDAPEATIARDFPGADSIPSAWLVAPSRATRFATENLRALPAPLLEMLRPWWLQSSICTGVAWVVAVLAGCGWLRLAAAGCGWCAAPAAASGAHSGLPWAVACTACVATAPWTSPRAELLLPLFVTFTWLTVQGVRQLGVFAARWLGIVAATLVGAGLVLHPRPFASANVMGTPIRDALALLAAVPANQTTRLLCATPGCLRAHSRAKQLDLIAPEWLPAPSPDGRPPQLPEWVLREPHLEAKAAALGLDAVRWQVVAARGKATLLRRAVD